MSEGTDIPHLIDVETLAAHLGDSVRHVRRLVAEQRIPYLEIGHFVRFDPAAINDWLVAQRVNEASPESRRRGVD